VDVYKLHLRNRKGKVDEHMVIGFLERQSGTAAAYLIPNFKLQTIAKFISKVVAFRSIVYTPFYQEVGWEFLEKYFDHRRLKPYKSKDYGTECITFRRLSGFSALWARL